MHLAQKNAARNLKHAHKTVLCICIILYLHQDVLNAEGFTAFCAALYKFAFTPIRFYRYLAKAYVTSKLYLFIYLFIMVS